MISMISTASAFFLLLPLVSASLTFLTPPTDSILQSYGTAEAQISLLLTTSPSESILNKSISFNQPHPICTHSDLTSIQISPEQQNITAILSFDAFPGQLLYTISIITLDPSGTRRSHTANGVYHVYGMALYQQQAETKTIYTGDLAPPLTFPHHSAPPRRLLAKIHAPQPVSLQHTAVSVRPLMGNADTHVISPGGVTFEQLQVSVQPDAYRVGEAVVSFEMAQLELLGEVFETQLVVSVSGEPSPPPVVTTVGNVVARREGRNSGNVSFGLEMFNVPKEGVYADMCGERFDAVEGTNGTVRFYGSCEAGKYEAEVKVEQGDVRAVSEEFYVIVPEGNGDVGGGGKKGGGRIWGIVGGCIGGVAIILVGVGAGLGWRARMAAIRLESSWSSTEADFGSEVGVDIARDVYGRGSVHVQYV